MSAVEIAHEVIAGKWGNGESRKNRLKAAGYDPNLIQVLVNEILESGKDVLEVSVDPERFTGVIIRVEG